MHIGHAFHLYRAWQVLLLPSLNTKRAWVLKMKKSICELLGKDKDAIADAHAENMAKVLPCNATNIPPGMGSNNSDAGYHSTDNKFKAMKDVWPGYKGLGSTSWSLPMMILLMSLSHRGFMPFDRTARFKLMNRLWVSVVAVTGCLYLDAGDKHFLVTIFLSLLPQITSERKQWNKILKNFWKNVRDGALCKGLLVPNIPNSAFNELLNDNQFDTVESIEKLDSNLAVEEAAVLHLLHKGDKQLMTVKRVWEQLIERERGHCLRDAAAQLSKLEQQKSDNDDTSASASTPLPTDKAPAYSPPAAANPTKAAAAPSSKTAPRAEAPPAPRPASAVPPFCIGDTDDQMQTLFQNWLKRGQESAAEKLYAANTEKQPPKKQAKSQPPKPPPKKKPPKPPPKEPKKKNPPEDADKNVPEVQADPKPRQTSNIEEPVLVEAEEIEGEIAAVDLAQEQLEEWSRQREKKIEEMRRKQAANPRCWRHWDKKKNSPEDADKNVPEEQAEPPEDAEDVTKQPAAKRQKCKTRGMKMNSKATFKQQVGVHSQVYVKFFNRRTNQIKYNGVELPSEMTGLRHTVAWHKYVDENAEEAEALILFGGTVRGTPPTVNACWLKTVDLGNEGGKQLVIDLRATDELKFTQELAMELRKERGTVDVDSGIVTL